VKLWWTEAAVSTTFHLLELKKNLEISLLDPVTGGLGPFQSVQSPPWSFHKSSGESTYATIKLLLQLLCVVQFLSATLLFIPTHPS